MPNVRWAMGSMPSSLQTKSSRKCTFIIRRATPKLATLLSGALTLKRLPFQLCMHCLPLERHFFAHKNQQLHQAQSPFRTRDQHRISPEGRTVQCNDLRRIFWPNCVFLMRNMYASTISRKHVRDEPDIWLPYQTRPNLAPLENFSALQGKDFKPCPEKHGACFEHFVHLP